MSEYKELSFEATDRILILAPHPDDETIATGGVIQKALAMGLPIHVCFFTYGDNNETSFIAYRKRPVAPGKAVQQMGLVRHDEALAATSVLGLRPEQLTFLGYPDFRCLAIWTEHWGDAGPCESMFTHTNAVPYPNAYRPGAPYLGDEVLADIKNVLLTFKPTKVFVSHPADHNPDHIALHLFARVALWNVSGQLKPQLIPFLVHHPVWPEPPGLSPRLALKPPERLQHDTWWMVNPLTPEQVERKASALQKHATQYKMSAPYLNSFMRANELFGDFEARALEQGDSGKILAKTTINAQVVPPQLTNAERVKWVGVERRAVWQEAGSVVVAADFSRPLGNQVSAATYLFGYRPDRPFAQMPKIQVRFSEDMSGVFDQSKRLVKSPVQLVRSARGFVMRVPLDFLGDPCYIMGSVRTYVRKVPLDWVAWRILEVNAGG